MNRSTRIAAALSVLVLIAAACGSDDDSSAETTPGTATDATAAVPADTGAADTDTDATDPGTTEPVDTQASTASSDPEPTDSGAVDTIKVGYSAWPGWFPLAVAEQAGIFDEVGLDVDLVYFADYIASIDAMAAGELDFVTQTLNDTMASVAFGSEQVIVVGERQLDRQRQDHLRRLDQLDRGHGRQDRRGRGRRRRPLPARAGPANPPA